MNRHEVGQNLAELEYRQRRAGRSRRGAHLVEALLGRLRGVSRSKSGSRRTSLASSETLGFLSVACLRSARASVSRDGP